MRFEISGGDNLLLLRTCVERLLHQKLHISLFQCMYYPTDPLANLEPQNELKVVRKH